MAEPSRDQLARAFVALTPFVRAYNLSLTAEDLEEMASAVLTHADSQEPLEAIVAAVERQIVEAALAQAQQQDAAKQAAG